MIPPDMYAQLPPEVKDIMKLQHAYYLERYKSSDIKPKEVKPTFNRPIRKKPDKRRNIHLTSTEDTTELPSEEEPEVEQ